MCEALSVLQACTMLTLIFALASLACSLILGLCPFKDINGSKAKRKIGRRFVFIRLGADLLALASAAADVGLGRTMLDEVPAFLGSATMQGGLFAMHGCIVLTFLACVLTFVQVCSLTCKGYEKDPPRAPEMNHLRLGQSHAKNESPASFSGVALPVETQPHSSTGYAGDHVHSVEMYPQANSQSALTFQRIKDAECIPDVSMRHLRVQMPTQAAQFQSTAPCVALLPHPASAPMQPDFGLAAPTTSSCHSRDGTVQIAPFFGGNPCSPYIGMHTVQPACQSRQPDSGLAAPSISSHGIHPQDVMAMVGPGNQCA